MKVMNFPKENWIVMPVEEGFCNAIVLPTWEKDGKKQWAVQDWITINGHLVLDQIRKKALQKEIEIGLNVTGEIKCL